MRGLVVQGEFFKGNCPGVIALGRFHGGQLFGGQLYRGGGNVRIQ